MSERDGDVTGLRISITPEPTDEEIAAVAAVVTALAASSSVNSATERTPQRDRWALAGRREALRGPFWRDDASGTGT